MAEFIRQISAEFRLVRLGMLWATVALICAVAGPFGTFQIGGFSARLIFWAIVSLVAMCIGWAVRIRSERMGLSKDSVWPAVVTATASAFVIGPIVHVLLRWWFRTTSDRLPETTDVLIVVFLLTLGVGLLGVAIVPPEQSKPDDGTVDALPRLVRRLDPALQGALISVSVRDHYVDVRTDAGQGSILMRFSDAIAECAPVEGVQVHRSHWVAWSAIESVKRDGARLTLSLFSGDSVPVSRNHRAKLVERGLA